MTWLERGEGVGGFSRGNQTLFMAAAHSARVVIISKQALGREWSSEFWTMSDIFTSFDIAVGCNLGGCRHGIGH